MLPCIIMDLPILRLKQCLAGYVGQFLQALRSRSGITETVDVWKRTMWLDKNKTKQPYTQLDSRKQVIAF